MYERPPLLDSCNQYPQSCSLPYFENITAMIGFKYISYCTTEEEEAGKTSCM